MRRGYQNGNALPTCLKHNPLRANRLRCGEILRGLQGATVQATDLVRPDYPLRDMVLTRCGSPSPSISRSVRTRSVSLLRLTYEFSRLLRCSSETVDDAAFATNVSAAVLVEPFLSQYLDEVLMSCPRVQEQRQMIFLGQGQL